MSWPDAGSALAFVYKQAPLAFVYEQALHSALHLFINNLWYAVINETATEYKSCDVSIDMYFFYVFICIIFKILRQLLRNYLCFLNKNFKHRIRNRATYSSDVSSFPVWSIATNLHNSCHILPYICLTHEYYWSKKRKKWQY